MVTMKNSMMRGSLLFKGYFHMHGKGADRFDW